MLTCAGTWSSCKVNPEHLEEKANLDSSLCQKNNLKLPEEFHCGWNCYGCCFDVSLMTNEAQYGCRILRTTKLDLFWWRTTYFKYLSVFTHFVYISFHSLSECHGCQFNLTGKEMIILQSTLKKIKPMVLKIIKIFEPQLPCMQVSFTGNEKNWFKFSYNFDLYSITLCFRRVRFLLVDFCWNAFWGSY